MFYSKKAVEQRLRETEAKRENDPSVKGMKEITEKYLEEISGGRGWWRAYARWTRSF